MTLLATNDSRVICRIQLTGEGRWVRLSLSLAALTSATRSFVDSEHLLYEMAAVDEVARQYGLANWQGGVISGARYAFRALKAPIQQVCLHELRGQLSSGDVWAISSAAALAVAQLLACPPAFPLDLGGWKVEEEVGKPQSAEAASQSAKVASLPQELLQERAENRSPTSGEIGTNGGTEDLPAEPGATADRLRE